MAGIRSSNKKSKRINLEKLAALVDKLKTTHKKLKTARGPSQGHNQSTENIKNDDGSVDTSKILLMS